MVTSTTGLPGRRLALAPLGVRQARGDRSSARAQLGVNKPGGSGHSALNDHAPAGAADVTPPSSVTVNSGSRACQRRRHPDPAARGPEQFANEDPASPNPGLLASEPLEVVELRWNRRREGAALAQSPEATPSLALTSPCGRSLRPPPLDRLDDDDPDEAPHSAFPPLPVGAPPTKGQ